MGDRQRSATQYDLMAEAYAADNLVSPFNAYYERPATQELVGDVSGRRVLELGCGAGPLTAWLVEKGAVVTGLDVSPMMARLARGRVGDRALILVGDLAGPMPFPDAGFEVVVASLVFHYVADWIGPLSELRRVLVPGGAVVFSTHHPAMDAPVHSPDNYFAVKQVTEVWDKGTGQFEVSFWRRPLTAMTEAIHKAGFVVERLVEPMPLPELEKRDPRGYRALTTRPRFLFFRLKPDPTGNRL